ncbi:WecB/TagA/CpsF family glycosyltransferase [Spirochaeta cellobiosiphila]|uniref:WecB/TagA/CpsF family glycosyltransferase n=1 Tax=Spirochaeta cellobiosiphila TaxID=504483 RepID=UPI0003FAEAA5|nr:WecB/TagA/CpsF family glycosyltransferase [Spirochaeta cellobiosiphila]
MENIIEAKRVYFLRIPIDIVPPDALEPIILNLLDKKEHQQIIFLSFSDFMKARRDKEYFRMLENAGLVIPLSKSLQNGMKFLKLDIPQQYEPFHFVIRTLGILENYRRSLYILGGKKQVTQISDNNLRSSFPGISMVGRYSGYYPKNMEKDIKTAIQKSNPSFLLIGDGIKKANSWVYQNRKHLNEGLSLYVKSIFQIIAGRKRRPDREKFLKGQSNIGKTILNPLKYYRLFQYIYYYILLFISKIRSPKN